MKGIDSRANLHSRQIAVVLQAPIVSFVCLSAAAAGGWKIIEWVYQLRIEALQERLARASHRLLQSSEEVAGLRRDLLEAKSKAPAPVTMFDYDAYIAQLGNIAEANDGDRAGDSHEEVDV